MRTVLRCYKLREIERPSFRDAVCSRIAQQVTAARIAYGESICIEFADGSAIQISLQDAAYLGAEAVSFDTGKEEWWSLCRVKKSKVMGEYAWEGL